MELEEEVKRAKGTGWKSVYDALRTEILSLEQPPGQLLDETTLAERFEMSRSPVREALIRLAGEDLVVTLPNRSTIVAPLELSAFPKYVDALDIAQRMNTRLAAECRTEEDLKIIARQQRRFETAVKTGNHLAMSAANKDFHMAIAHAGQNPYLAGFYERLLDQGRRMMHMHFNFLERTSEGYLLTDEHDEMLEAIRARDVAKADELAHAHTRQFRDNFIDFMSKTYTKGVSLGQSTVLGHVTRRRDVTAEPKGTGDVKTPLRSAAS
ncbi:DNA-binding transcriptional regulator, GntR family [Variovorax sp. HW608]|uniref:GntR family transcriptional regulator n=1 Tax=Variovorax sp. HW608 TaxID=1034889 RepID=UPI00081FB41B|nr:GntR family transcriptional regulator [Variovorax sp. HW608]SCK19840.1 DNA-binding transcriptional regulator, GntR family [Variovorax sp. HW608]